MQGEEGVKNRMMRFMKKSLKEKTEKYDSRKRKRERGSRKLRRRKNLSHQISKKLGMEAKYLRMPFWDS